MRTSILAILGAAVFLVGAPLYGAPLTDLTFTLDSNTGTGYATNLAPDADPPCLQPDCVLFTGTLTNTDDDPSNSYPMILYDIGVTFASNPASGLLSLDNTFFFDVPALSTDPGYLLTGNPPDTYYGPVFGIDIAPDTTPGIYNGTVTIYGAGGLQDEDYNGFTVTQDITVDVVAPEPGAAGLLLAGLLPFAVWLGVKRKWRSSEASR